MKVIYLGILIVILLLIVTVPFSGIMSYLTTITDTKETEISGNNAKECRISHGSTVLRDKRRPIKHIPTEYNEYSLDKLRRLVTRNATSRDPDVISLVREWMDPPSGHMIKNVRPIVSTPQSIEVLTLLNNKKNGFFVEVGALDGERSSNTLFLETQYGWTGLLIEMDPYYYTQLRGRSRHSWSINACVSPYDHPIVTEFKEDSGGKGTLLGYKGTGKTKTSKDAVPCFPLESMLLALNTTHVDYWSLDVEGFELDILRTIPFDRLDITVLSVEYVHGRNGKEAYREFMEGKGYKVHKDIKVRNPRITLYVDDYIFTKQ